MSIAPPLISALVYVGAVDNSTDTCKTMNSVAQYLTVFLGNLTNSLERTPNCQARPPFCNSFFCQLPNRAGYYNNTFLPCDNPVGFSTQVVDRLANISQNYTLYESGVFNATSYSSSELTLNQLGPGKVGFGVSLWAGCGRGPSREDMPARLHYNTKFGYETSHQKNNLSDYKRQHSTRISNLCTSNLMNHHCPLK